jgi:hypothetical protein
MSIKVCVRASFFLHGGDGYLHHDRLFKLRHFKKDDLFSGSFEVLAMEKLGIQFFSHMTPGE